jgi:hypothetical protein
MTSKLLRLVSLLGLAAAIVTAYVAFQRVSVNVEVREANEAIQAAISRSQRAVAMSQALRALTTEENLKTNRAAIVAAAREASAESLAVSELYKIATVRAQAASDGSDTEFGKKYWRIKCDAMSKLGEAAAASAAGYAVWDDPTNPELETIRERQRPHADKTEAARAEADRLNAEAEKLAAENRGKF